MRGLLIYNPASGQHRERRDAVIAQVAAVLRGQRHVVDVVATKERGGAAGQVRAAIEAGAEVVFACGGDGTVHDVLQGVAGTKAALAAIPMGSGNALARELGVPLDPVAAARAFARSEAVDVRLARAEAGGSSRSFLVMAGAGPDGALMYRMLTVDRSRWGRWAYAAHALRLLVCGRFEAFGVRYRVRDDAAWGETRAVSVMAMRVGSLGGVFPGVARGASLHGETMRVVLVKGPAWLGLPLWFAMNWLGLERWNPLLVRVDAVAFACENADATVHAQVDGEWVGRLPMSVTLTGETVRLMVPSER
jgi:diacylglycerol kinase family enzyme